MTIHPLSQRHHAGTLVETAEFDDATNEVIVTDHENGDAVTRVAADEPTIEGHNKDQRRLRLEQAVDTLEQWAADARGTTVTNGNNTQVTQVLVDRLGIFFDRFADLLRETRGIG